LKIKKIIFVKCKDMDNYFSDISSVSIPDDLTGKQLSDLTRKQLLDIIKAVCYNGDMDPSSFVEWDSREMSLEQLRTVVVLLDDDMLDLLEARRRRPGEFPPYAPCNLLESLYRWTTTNPNGREIYTQRVITPYQRTQIAAAYMASLSPAERQRLEEEEQERINERDANREELVRLLDEAIVNGNLEREDDVNRMRMADRRRVRNRHYARAMLAILVWLGLGLGWLEYNDPGTLIRTLMEDYRRIEPYVQRTVQGIDQFGEWYIHNLIREYERFARQFPEAHRTMTEMERRIEEAFVRAFA